MSQGTSGAALDAAAQRRANRLAAARGLPQAELRAPASPKQGERITLAGGVLNGRGRYVDPLNFGVV